jgi:cellulose synthase/poly-beta-1,6-N-acetylglucosamine synthase-like glycosyltransferase
MFLLFLLFWFWLFSYAAAIAWVVSLFSKPYNKQNISQSIPSKLAISVVVAARDEATNIQQLLADLQEQTLPNHVWELIVVNDHSTDRTLEVVWPFTSSLPLTIVSLDRKFAGKKIAVAAGIAKAKGEWIVCTDADCRVGPNWLASFWQCMDKEIVWISAPVFIQPASGSFIHQFQQVDLIPVMAFTEAFFKLKMPIMSNGANMAFPKRLYTDGEKTPGGNLASGDDVFLMQKAFQQRVGKLLFADSVENVVKTLPVDTWTELLQQRTRWAGKWKAMSESPVKSLAVYVFLSNLLAAICLIFGIITFSPLALSFYGIKMVLEIWLVLQYANKYKQSIPALGLLISSLIYPFFAVFIGIYATLQPRFQWKSRSYSTKP